VNVLIGPALAIVFSRLRVCAALHHAVPWWGNEWWAIEGGNHLLRIEDEHGAEASRAAHNERNMKAALRRKRIVEASRNGHSDVFVPIVVEGKVVATLVVGPFFRTRPTSTDLLERWSALTGREGHLDDPEFSAFLQAVRATLVLEEPDYARFLELLGRLARLIAGEASPQLLREVFVLNEELEPVRDVEQAWQTVNEMIDERTPHLWESVNYTWELKKLGLSNPPNQALVGLAVMRASGHTPVDDAQRLDAFQRAVVALARRAGETVAGRVGEHGVVLLGSRRGAPTRKKQKLRELAERVAVLGRQRFGLALHFGACVGSDAAPNLPRVYQTALGAAEAALTQGERLVFAEADAYRRHDSLRKLRRELVRSFEERPAELTVRFDRFLEAVALESGHRFEPARAHVDAAFERLTEELLRSGALDAKSSESLNAALDRSLSSARTLSELFAAYRVAVSDVSAAVQSPASARQDRSLRRAIEYIREHLSERLSVNRMAKVAGFNSTYFSVLFKKRERITFEKYVLAQRLERAKALLSRSKLSVTRVAELCGYPSLPHFSRAFRRELRMTPLAYRRAHPLSRDAARPPKTRNAIQ
jgi:AraC-like DNA-binding protein